MAFTDIKLIVSEVDGIIADPLYPIDELGNVPFKYFYGKDFEAINELKKFFKFVFISSDNRVSYNLFRRKNIPFYWAEKDKRSILLEIMRRYNKAPSEVLYIGCSLSDISCMEVVDFSMCPSDSVYDVMQKATVKLDAQGGYGVLCEVVDALKEATMYISRN